MKNVVFYTCVALFILLPPILVNASAKSPRLEGRAMAVFSIYGSVPGGRISGTGFFVEGGAYTALHNLVGVNGLWIETLDEGDRLAVEAQQLFRIEGRMELVTGLPGKDHVLRSKSLHGGDHIIDDG